MGDVVVALGRDHPTLGEVHVVTLGDHLALGHAGVIQHVVDGLLAGPPLGVDAGVDNQADGAEDLGLEVAEAVEGVVLEAVLALGRSAAATAEIDVSTRHRAGAATGRCRPDALAKEVRGFP